MAALPRCEVELLVAGLVLGATGALLWTLAQPVGAVRRPGAASLAAADRRPESWSRRRLLLAAASVVFLVAAPTAFVLGADHAGAGYPLAGVALIGVGLGLWKAASPKNESSWHERRREARARVERPQDAWTWDRGWDPQGERRRFLRYLRTRPMFLGRFALVFFLVALSGSRDPFLLGLRVVLGAAVAVWTWRIATVWFMGDAFLGFQRFPFQPGERVALTFGVSPGGAEIRDAAIVLRHWRDRRDTGGDVGTPHCTATIEEATDAGPRTIVPGVDQPLLFDVPEDAPGTSISAANASWWEVEVRGTTKLGPYEERFFVPVYARSRTGSGMPG